jgi:hypothetical protein
MIHSFYYLHLFSGTFRAYTVTEQSLRMITDIVLQLIPVLLIISDLMTIRADRNDPLQLFYLGQCCLDRKSVV